MSSLQASFPRVDNCERCMAELCARHDTLSMSLPSGCSECITAVAALPLLSSLALDLLSIIVRLCSAYTTSCTGPQRMGSLKIRQSR